MDKKIDHKKELLKLFHNLTNGRWDTWTVFQDFLTIAAITISNAVDKKNKDIWERRENLYLKTIEKYNKNELDIFAQLFAELTLALEDNMEDVLGQIYQQLSLNNKWRGQFFTPDSVSYMMGAMMFTKETIKAQIQEKGHVEMYEPCCGGGALIINAAKAIREAGYNYQDVFVVLAGDIDIKAVYMTYIQCSLLGIQAKVTVANALSEHPYGESENDIWYTPMVFMVDGLRKAEEQRQKELKKLEQMYKDFEKLFKSLFAEEENIDNKEQSNNIYLSDDKNLKDLEVII